MSLREFLRQIEDKRELIHVKDRMSPLFEIPFLIKKLNDCELVTLFENVEHFQNSVVANVTGNRKRTCEAIGVSREGLYERLIEAWRSTSKPRVSSDGAVRENMVKTVDLTKLPILTHFRKDGGPYITAGIIHAKSPDGKTENVSIHRLQVLDRNHLAIRLVPRHLFRLWNMARETGKDLDVAISIGVHPAILLAASSPVAFGKNEFDVANSLLDDNLRLIDCQYVDSLAPAESELVLEGRISTEKEAAEGPFVDITGTYDIRRMQPVVEIVGYMHRNDYVYESILPAGTEHRILMGLPHEAMIWDSVKKVVPEVHAVNLTVGGSGWLHAAVSIEKQVEGDGKNALLAAFAAHPSLKHAIVVDSDIDVFDVSDVEWAFATRFQASEDLIIIENARGSTLDSSANQDTGSTTKVGFDATRPLSKPKSKFERAKTQANKRVSAIADRLRECPRRRADSSYI